MPPIQGWFKARKLFQASQKVYYEDIFGENNPEEHLEGSHILDSESESDPEFFSRRARRQIRKESRNILRRNNKDQLDRREEMQTANGDETVAPTTDKVVTIDDDSDVDEQFVSDLRNCAQDSVSGNDEDDMQVIPEPNSQDEMDAAFLADVRTYARPPPIDNESHDELLERINQRAKSFANQSPLTPKERFEPEPNATTVLPSIEKPDDRSVDAVPDDRNGRGAPDHPIDRLLVEVVNHATDEGVNKVGNFGESSPAAVVQRDHSWDPSQGSDYVYSDEEAEDRRENTDLRHEHPHNENNHDINHDDDRLDKGDEDREFHIDDATLDKTRSHDEQILISEVQNESRNGPAKLVSTRQDSPRASENDNDDKEVIDLTSPTPPASEETPLRTTRSFRFSSQGFGSHDSSTSPEYDRGLTRTRKRPFGLFASKPGSSVEADFDGLSDGTPPRRLRDLVRERARKRLQEAPMDKARYNLRPRRQHKSYNTVLLFDESASVANKSDSGTEDEAEETHKPRRTTRSMAARVSVKKPIPRFKAARKSAWTLVPRDDTRRSASRQIVEVVIPRAVDRSACGLTRSSTSPTRIERRQPSAVNKASVILKGEHKLGLALAGKGMKRTIPNNTRIDEEENISNRHDVSEKGKQEMPFVLID